MSQLDHSRHFEHEVGVTASPAAVALLIASRAAFGDALQLDPGGSASRCACCRPCRARCLVRRGTDRAQAFAPPVSRKPGHCAFKSATVEASNGLAVASNRLASMTKFASMLTTDSRNGASRRVPATGASATSISRPSERYLTRAFDEIWPTMGS